MSKRWLDLSYSKRKAITRMVFTIKGDKCYRCGMLANSVDHIIPDSVGGSHTVDNLDPCCVNCNSKRKDSPTGDGRYGAKAMVIVTPNHQVFTDYIANHVCEDVDVVVSRYAIGCALHNSIHVTSLVDELYEKALFTSLNILQPCTVWIHLDVVTDSLMTALVERMCEFVYLDDFQQTSKW